jgi:O-antigen ligase
VIDFSVLKEREGFALSFFFSIFFVVFLCLLQFNALPSGQLFLAPIVILLITYLIANPASWLLVVSIHRKTACIFAIGPLYLIISSLSYSYWPWLSLWMSASFVLLPISALLIISFRSIRYKYFIYGFVGAVLVNSLIIQFLAYQGVARPAGFLDDPNLAANFCALALLSTLFLIQEAPKKRFYLIAFMLGVALFISLSRGAVFALVGAVIIYLSLCQYKKLPWSRALLIFGLILVFSFLVASVILANQSGLSGLSINDRPESLSDRFDLWRSAWDMFLEHPLLGTGMGTFTLRYPALRAFSETSSTGFFAHNDYLQLLAELGILGFLAWFIVPLTLLVLAVRSYLRADSEMGTGVHCLAISAASLVGAHSLFNFVMYHPVINVFLGCVLGVSITTDWLKSAPAHIAGNKKTSFFKVRAALIAALVLISVSFTADIFSRKPIADAALQGANFNFRSDSYYDLLALKHFSPLNVAISNYLVAGDVNSVLSLADMPLGEDLARQVISRIDESSWLLWENCPQLVNKARLKWLTDEQAAIAILESVLAKMPSCIQARITLSEGLMSTNKYSEAIRVLNLGVDRFVFRENLGDGSVSLLETLIQAYRLSGQEGNADAIEAYLQQFKRQRSRLQSPKWSRRLQF